MKQALLIVSFGTSVPSARRSITAVEEALAGTLPDADVYRAFTSPTIRKILRGRGETVLGLEEALEAIAPMGYDRVIVQPTHLLYGIEYDKIRETVGAWRFGEIPLGKPLLAQTGDLLALAQCLKEEYASEGEALVLMGHGTEHFANMVYPAFQTVLRLSGFPNAYVGTVEGWPGIDRVTEQLRGDGQTRALLVPLMLVAGDHACNDMAGKNPSSWKSRLEAQGIAVRCHLEGLGLLPRIQELYRQHLQELVTE